VVFGNVHGINVDVQLVCRPKVCEKGMMLMGGGVKVTCPHIPGGPWEGRFEGMIHRVS